MPKPNIIILITFLTLVSFVPTVPAALVDAETQWLIVDATPDARAHESLDALTELLVNRGKVPREQIHRLEGERATSAEIQALLAEMQGQGTLIFLYHGAVTKPRGMNAMHLLTQDEAKIEDKVLNRWFKASGVGQTVVIIDGYTEDTNLSAYYANRETLGDAALNAIQSASVTDTDALLQKIETRSPRIQPIPTTTASSASLKFMSCYGLPLLLRKVSSRRLQTLKQHCSNFPLLLRLPHFQKERKFFSTMKKSAPLQN